MTVSAEVQAATANCVSCSCLVLRNPTHFPARTGFGCGLLFYFFASPIAFREPNLGTDMNLTSLPHGFIVSCVWQGCSKYDFFHLSSCDLPASNQTAQE